MVQADLGSLFYFILFTLIPGYVQPIKVWLRLDLARMFHVLCIGSVGIEGEPHAR
jgi:hypothetical protein